MAEEPPGQSPKEPAGEPPHTETTALTPPLLPPPPPDDDAATKPTSGFTVPPTSGAGYSEPAGYREPGTASWAAPGQPAQQQPPTTQLPLDQQRPPYPSARPPAGYRPPPGQQAAGYPPPPQPPPHAYPVPAGQQPPPAYPPPGSGPPYSAPPNSAPPNSAPPGPQPPQLNRPAGYQTPPPTGPPNRPNGPPPAGGNKPNTGLFVGLGVGALVLVLLLVTVGVGIALSGKDDDRTGPGTAAPSSGTPSTKASPSDSPQLAVFRDEGLKDFARRGVADAKECAPTDDVLVEEVYEAVKCEYPSGFEVRWVRYRNERLKAEHVSRLVSGWYTQNVTVDENRVWTDGDRGGRYIDGKGKGRGWYVYWDQDDTVLAGEIFTEVNNKETVNKFWESHR